MTTLPNCEEQDDLFLQVYRLSKEQGERDDHV